MISWAQSNIKRSKRSGMLRQAPLSTHWGTSSQSPSAPPLSGGPVPRAPQKSLHTLWGEASGGLVWALYELKIVSRLPPQTPRREPAPCTPAPQKRSCPEPNLHIDFEVFDGPLQAQLCLGNSATNLTPKHKRASVSIHI
jgi:hypothetical protein